MTRWLRRVGMGLALLAGVVAAAQAPAAAAADDSACPPALPASSASEPARDRGLLWRLERQGRVSWLYGTLHLGKPAWERLGPKLAAALRASDTLALEVDAGDPQLAASMARAVAEAAPAALPVELTERLARAAARACLPATLLAGHPPVLQASALTLLDARWLGLDASYASEQVLLGQARSARLRVVALETAAMQASALLQGGDGQARALVEQTLQQLEDHTSRDVLQRLATAWEQGDLARLEDYAQWCDCAPAEDDRAFLRRLNDERNPKLADGIAALHARGRRVLAAVGALHMTGPAALPRLLAERGFRVRRVPLP